MRKCLANLADLHEGHPLALPPGPDGWELADGNYVQTNDWQKTIWQHFDETGRHTGDLRKGGQLIVTIAGDPKEGLHHGSLELMVFRDDEQERMVIAALQHWLACAKFNPRKGDRLIVLSGTEAHDPNQQSTERIARTLLRTDDLDGCVIRPRLYASVNGCIFDVAHKGYRLGSREWTRTNSMRAYLQSQWFTNLKAHKPMPRYIIRAHFHTFGYASLEDDTGATISEGYLMPAWKLVDSYVRGFAPEAVANIGMLAFVVEANGTSRAYPLLMRCEQDEVEEL